jgi:hypothetical protein
MSDNGFFIAGGYQKAKRAWFWKRLTGRFAQRKSAMPML